MTHLCCKAGTEALSQAQHWSQGSCGHSEGQPAIHLHLGGLPYALLGLLIPAHSAEAVSTKCSDKTFRLPMFADKNLGSPLSACK